MEFDASKADPLARRMALVPVVVIATAVVAYLVGFRLDGRQAMTLDWRVHAVAENGFSVLAPGLFIINRQPLNFDGEDAVAQTYVASDLGADFSVTVARRPDADTRPVAEVAKSLGVNGAEAAQSAGDLTRFSHDITLEGKRTQALLIFRDRTLYQLMVTSPAATFPSAKAEQFFSSFRFGEKT